MPRTMNFPSDLIDTQALSLARTVTSNGVALAAIAPAAAKFGLVAPAVLGVVVSDDGTVGLVTVETPAFEPAEFRSTEVGVVAPGGAPALGAVLVVEATSVLVAPEAAGVEGAPSAELAGCGVALTGAVAEPGPLA
jgi:hypothetical protein